MLRKSTADIMGSPIVNTIPTNSNNSNNNMHYNNNNSSNVLNGNTSALDALPKQFVLSMKKLFDILDDQRCGFVKLTDIEKGWQDDGSKGLPRGVIQSLRKVTPTSGLLSFERFCAGLKLCLWRNQQVAESVCMPKSQSKQSRPPSAPLLDPAEPLPCPPSASLHPCTQAVITTRALSMPQLSPDSEIDCEFSPTPLNVYNSPPPPPKPPRASMVTNCVGVMKNNGPNVNMNKTEIRHALQNWQMSILLNEQDKTKNRNQFDYRGFADGGSSSATDSGSSVTAALQAKKSNTKRREPRRHTLQNGIDYNMLKRLKLYEEERELLLLGLDSVEKSRDWFMEQVLNVQEKIKYFGRIDSTFEPFSDVHQERLNFQRARVLEVNRSLSNLAHTWERGGYPFHINLAIRTPSKGQNKRYSTANPRVFDTAPPLLTTGSERLEQQNRHLTNETSLKSERIVHLEREKQTLLNELYDLQQRIEIGRKSRNVTGFVLSQPSPVSQSSSVLDDADVVY